MRQADQKPGAVLAPALILLVVIGGALANLPKSGGAETNPPAAETEDTEALDEEGILVFESSKAEVMELDMATPNVIFHGIGYRGRYPLIVDAHGGRHEFVESFLERLRIVETEPLFHEKIETLEFLRLQLDFLEFNQTLDPDVVDWARRQLEASAGHHS